MYIYPVSILLSIDNMSILTAGWFRLKNMYVVSSVSSLAPPLEPSTKTQESHIILVLTAVTLVPYLLWSGIFGVQDYLLTTFGVFNMN